MPLEIGSCPTVASLPKLPPMTLPWDFSKANLNVGSSLPESSGSGTLFLKGKSVTSTPCHIAGLLCALKQPTSGYRWHYEPQDFCREGSTACYACSCRVVSSNNSSTE